MTPDQFETFKKIQAMRPLVYASDLWGEKERTLLLGYDVGRETLHVYLRGGLIHRVVATSHGEVLEHQVEPYWLAEYLVEGQKRWYPEASDQDFAVKLARGKTELFFTSFDKERAEHFGLVEGLFYGPVCECLMGEGHHWMA